MRRIGCFMAVALLLLSLFGCGEVREAVELQRALVEEFGTEDITVSFSAENILKVSFDDWAADRKDEQAAVARQAAEFVRDNYEGYPDLSAVEVAFGWTQAGITTTGEPYRFTPEELSRPAPETMGDTTGGSEPTAEMS
ncbi:MAG: hypothetical protein GF405_02330 [Candidatus Eisenbacteria bacterium]|nr:hypothetical protein [Candidatus Eisenbacteria bacterium]